VRQRRLRSTLLFVFIAAACSCPAPPAPEQRAATLRLTIERLYSLPHIIGTAPKGIAWSRDSQ